MKAIQKEMRDKLIELLSGKSIDTVADVEYVADELIANGAILPPCKVGDTVYVITNKIPCYACISCTNLCHKMCPYPDRGNLVVKTAKVRSIEIGKFYKIRVEIEEDQVTDSYDHTYWFCDIGDTIFLTREEAEKKLEEKQNESNT